MAAKFFFYPQPSGNQLITIDLDEDLAELYSDWEYTSSTGQSMNGKITTTTQLNREIVTIIRDRMQGGEDLANQFFAMQNHLDRGFSVAFCSDHTKAYAFPLKSSPIGGSTVIDVFQNPFYNLTSQNLIPQVGDYVVLESSPPGAIYEVCKVAGVNASFTATSGGQITLANPINFTYTGNVFLRYYRFFPVMKRRESDRGRSIITNEHGIAWSLELTLTPDYSLLYKFHPSIDSDFSPGGASSYTLPDAQSENITNVWAGMNNTLDKPPERLTGSVSGQMEIEENAPWYNWQSWGN